MWITKEFCESDMRKKLKDCQNIRVRDYQHCRDYVEGDKVWFQSLNGNTWLESALVVTQRGQSIYFHTHLKKIAAYRFQLYELIHTEIYSPQNTQHTEEHTTSNTREVMLEDGLEDIENITQQSLMITTTLQKRRHTQIHTPEITLQEKM